MEKVVRVINWLMEELIKNNRGYALIHLCCNISEGEFKIYLEGQQIATITKDGYIFNFPLTDKQIAELYEITK